CWPRCRWVTRLPGTLGLLLAGRISELQARAALARSYPNDAICAARLGKMRSLGPASASSPNFLDRACRVTASAGPGRVARRCGCARSARAVAVQFEQVVRCGGEVPFAGDGGDS